MAATSTTTITILTLHQNLAQRQYLHMNQRFMPPKVITTIVVGVRCSPPTATIFVVAFVQTTTTTIIIITTTITITITTTTTMPQ